MTSEEVIEIAGAYGKLCTALATVSVCLAVDYQDGFPTAIKILREALDSYKSVVPTAMQNEIIRTQASDHTIDDVEKLLQEHE